MTRFAPRSTPPMNAELPLEQPAPQSRKPVMFALQTNVGRFRHDFPTTPRSTQFFDADTTVVLNFATDVSRHSDPGKIDDYRDNWWCPMDIEITMDSRVNDQWSSATPNLLQQSTESETPEFLSGVTAAEAEMDKLSKLSAVTDFVGSVVLQLAKSHPDDPRVREALSGIVRDGRYGCADVDTWKTTRPTFPLLQLKYPKSDWANRAPTRFNREQDIREELKARIR